MEKRNFLVVLCNCGGRISEKIDFNELKELVKKQEGIAEVLETKDFCINPEEQVKKLGKKFNGIIFCGCSERSSLKFNEDRIAKLLKNLEINPAMFETVNLREQCLMVHDDVEGMNQRAKDQLLTAYEKLRTNVEALKENLKKKVLVVGGGIAGQSCAQALSDMGIDTVIVEEKPYLGGFATSVPFLWQSESYPSVCTSQCVIPVVGRETLLRDRITVYTNSSIENIGKESGKFKVRVKRRSLKVDPQK